MGIENCNLCNKSLSKPGMGGTTVGVSLETNQITVSHTRCRDEYMKAAIPMHATPSIHSPDYDGDPVEDLNEWERQVLESDGFDC
jgi:hypothetical protein